MLTYKFRVYPSAQQQEKLLWVLGKCRFVYNEMLSGLNKQKKPDKIELQAMLPTLKERHHELNDVYSKVLQYEVFRLFSNLKVLGRLKKNGKKVGRLRFKGKEWFKTFTFNQSGFKIIFNGKRCQTLELSKIGGIRVRMHRNIKGKIKQVSIKRTKSGKWFACFSVEDGTEVHKKPIRKVVGIDLGIIHYIADTEGRFFDYPMYLNKMLSRLGKENRKLSRRRNPSNNKEKQRIRVALVHEKINYQRSDFLHKLSEYYVNNFDFVAVEDLNVRSLVKASYNARNIMDASWSKFIQVLSYKAERAGKTLIKVNPKNTSQLCSQCGVKVKKSLTVRVHKCRCGFICDRDFNAALNVLKKGLEKLPQGLREFTPVDIQKGCMKQEAAELIQR